MPSLSRHKRDGFTLVEVLTASLVMLYVVLGAWSIYLMGWTWWYEMSPTIEAQRAVRLALSMTIEGLSDPTAGTDTIGPSTYRRRNGLAGAMFDKNNPVPTTPFISSGNRRIDFRLERDSSNARAFYFNDSQQALYYIDSDSVSYRLDATEGLTDMRFNYYVDNTGTIHFDIIEVTATVSKDVVGTRDEPYHIEIRKSSYVYLRNALL